MPDLRTENDMLDYLDRELEEHSHVALSCDFIRSVWGEFYKGLIRLLPEYHATVTHTEGETLVVVTERPDEMTDVLTLTTKEEADA